jgi:OFA family oxalate/formate antiporter-like MFS transporter
VTEPDPGSSPAKVPAQAWVVTFAGLAVNLCLGILYGWSVWKSRLVATKDHPAGSAMTGLDAGWVYLTDAQATWSYALCGIMFAVFMVPGGRIQDRYGPRVGATLGGAFLAAGCIAAGLMRSYVGLLIGFGVMGGIGMGLGYAASTPAAVRWFGPHRRGLIVGLVVAGYGGAAIYIAPLARFLIDRFGISGSLIAMGVLFAVVVIVAGRLLAMPPAGYVPPGPPVRGASSLAPTPAPAVTRADWSARAMLGTWQFYALMFLFLGSAQSGLLVIANAAPMLNTTAGALAFFGANAWLLAAFGGFVNAIGRVGTGSYSDRIGRSRAYVINGVISAVCLLLMPRIMASGNVALLFLTVGVAYWQYGGTLALMPAFTADFYGSRNLGLNYGLVFLGWGVAFVVPLTAGAIKDATGSLDAAFRLSAGLLIAAVLTCLVLKRPTPADERSPLAASAKAV